MESIHIEAATVGATKIGAAWLLFVTSTLVPALTVVALTLTIVFTSFQIYKIARDLHRQYKTDQAKEKADAKR